MISPYVFGKRPIPVHVAGRRCTLPYAPAVTWVQALEGDLLGIVPGMLAEDDRADLLTRLATGDVPGRDLQVAALAVVAEVTGQPPQQAVRLLAASGDSLLGDMLLAGLDPERLSVGAWCAAALSLVMKNRDEKGRTKMEMKLLLPLPGMSPAEAEGWDMTEW